MNLDQLRYFQAAAQLENIGQASRQLHISPSAISHAISTLEAELELKVFLRHGKRIKLNANGQILLEEATRVLDAVERIPSAFQRQGNELRGRLKIGTTHSLAVRFLVRAASEIEEKNPKLSFDFKIAPTSELVGQLLGGQLDFAVCYGPLNHHDLVTESLSLDPFVIAVKKGSAVNTLKPKDRLGALSKMKAAAPRIYSGKKHLEHRALESLGIEQNVDFVFESYDVAIERLRVTQGVWALLPASWVKRTSGIEVVKLPKWECTETIVAVWPRARGLGLPGHALKENLLKELRKNTQ